MIKIAICDDETRMIERLKNYINSCMDESGIQYEISAFDKSRAFWYEVEDGVVFDIILLDIEMPGIDGMKLAEMFQELLPDAILIFVSAHKKYVFDSFRLDAFRFIPKDQLDDRIEEALVEAVWKIQGRTERYYIVENRAGMVRVPLRSIVKITREGKNIIIETEKGEKLYMRKSLVEVLNELPAEEFNMVIRGTICNLAQIVRIDEDGLLLKNGEKVPLVKGKVMELKQLVKGYWINRERVE